MKLTSVVQLMTPFGGATGIAPPPTPGHHNINLSAHDGKQKGLIAHDGKNKTLTARGT